MRKIILLAALALMTTIGISSCGKQAADTAVEAQALPTKPADASDTKGWQEYLVAVVRQNLQGMTAKKPYLYFIPAGDDDESMDQRQLQLDNVIMTVQRTVLPGNLMAFAGPDSTATGDFIVNAFGYAEKGSFKGVIVLFIGDEVDAERVSAALETSGATSRFVQM